MPKQVTVKGPQHHRCGFCKKRLPTLNGVQRHIQNTAACRRRWELKVTTASSDTDTINNTVHLKLLDDDSPIDYTTIPGSPIASSSSETFDDSARRYIDRFAELYPGPVATIFGEGVTTFERWEEENRDAGRSRWYPFQDEEEWDLAAWLAKNVGHNKIEEFLKLPKVCQLPFLGVCRLNQCITTDQGSESYHDK